MKKVNITSGEYLNNYLISKYEGLFIPFNETIIKGELLYPLFDNNYIENRAKIHNVDIDCYVEKLKLFLSLNSYLRDTELINLWFGKDAFCVINLISVLVYLEDNNYSGKVIVNVVDDCSNEVLEKDIEIVLGGFKNIYLSLMDRIRIKTNYDFIDKGLEDYLYITSNNNHVIDYVKDNIDVLERNDLIREVLDMTYEYGLSDVNVIDIINKCEKL